MVKIEYVKCLVCCNIVEVFEVWLKRKVIYNEKYSEGML